MANSTNPLIPYQLGIFGLVLLVVLLLLFYQNTDQHYRGLIQSQKDEFAQETEKREQQLGRYKLEQDSLVRILSERDHNIKVLKSDLDNSSKELAAVKGKYDKHTPTELEKEMEERFRLRDEE